MYIFLYVILFNSASDVSWKLSNCLTNALGSAFSELGKVTRKLLIVGART